MGSQVTTRDFEDRCYRAQPALEVQHRKADGWQGHWRGDHGIVAIDVARYPNGRASTMMRFIRDGHLHLRIWPRDWSEKTCTRLAGEFVASVLS